MKKEPGVVGPPVSHASQGAQPPYHCSAPLLH